MAKAETPADFALPADGATSGIVPGGTALGDLLYPPPAERRIGAIIGWWEKRRLPFNLMIGGTGLVSTAVISLFMAFNGGPGPAEWLRIGFFWLIAANVCYTLGPATEIALQRLLGRRLLPAGPLLFRAGLITAIGVALAPIIFVTIAYLATALGIGP